MWQLQPKGDEWNDCAALDYGCDRQAFTRGARFCRTHYNQHHRGELTPIRRRSPNGTRCGGPGLDGPECGRKDIYQNDPIPLCKAHAIQYNGTGAMQVIIPRHRFGSLERDDDGNKRCTSCREWLPEQNYGKSSSAGDGLTGRCLRCANDASRFRKFGITRKQYDAILAAQGGVCYTCKRPPGRGRESLSVDHNHRCCADKYKTCGSCIRGVICEVCNFILALVDDKPELLGALSKYLTEGVPHILALLQAAGESAA